MKPFAQRQIWLINFEPSVGHEYRKMRPGLIIESNQYTSVGSLLTVIPISSKVDKLNVLDILIAKSEINRLISNSLLKTMQISTFDRRRFIKYIGFCEEDVFEEVKRSVSLYLDLVLK